MNQPYLISGQGSEPDSYSGRFSQPRSGRLVKMVAVAWLLAGLGYLAYRFAFQAPPTPGAAPLREAAANAGATAISTEDIEHHMEAVNARIPASYFDFSKL